MFGRFFKCLFNKSDNSEDKVEQIKNENHKASVIKDAKIQELKSSRNTYINRCAKYELEVEDLKKQISLADYDEEETFNAGLRAGAREHVATSVKISDSKKGRKKKQNDEDAKQLLKAEIKKKAKAKAKKPKVDDDSIL